jgi:hypothetical protein
MQLNTFIVCRYLTFALFIILNVIIATVAAWNWGISQNAALTFQVDTFLIAIGILGTLLIFPLMFIELVRKGAFTSRIWFEITWVALFWLMNLSGAAALTAIEPAKSCSSFVRSSPWAAACTSTRVLLGFTWLSTVTLLIYLLALLICSVLHMHDNPRIWMSGVRDVDWFASSPRQIKSAPSTPVLPIFRQHSNQNVTLYTVSAQPAAIVTRPAVFAEVVHPKVAPVFTTPAPAITRQTISSNRPLPASTPSLYPQFVQPLVQARAAVAVEPVPTRQWRRSTSPTPVPQREPSSPTSPSRVDPRTGLKPLLMQSSSPTRTTPLGPRPKPRPPPLDLSGLSSFQSKSKRPDRPSRR